MSLKYEPASEPAGHAFLALSRLKDSGWERNHESRRCSRDTYPESYILVYEDNLNPLWSEFGPYTTVWTRIWSWFSE